jgi:hypothetical protein
MHVTLTYNNDMNEYMQYMITFSFDVMHADDHFTDFESA